MDSMDSNTSLFEPISINETSEKLESNYILALPENANIENGTQNYVKCFALVEEENKSSTNFSDYKAFGVNEISKENIATSLNLNLVPNVSLNNADSNKNNHDESQELVPSLLVSPEMDLTENAPVKNEQNQGTSNMQFVLNINTVKDPEGILYIGCNEEGEKTNPAKINEWFTPDFINMHKVYAIKEEEAFLLKIYTRVSEVANKVLRKKGGRKPMLMGQEVYGEIIIACGRCGYRSSEGSNVRRHLKKSVCARDRGYSKKELDGLNRTDRQKFIRRVAAAKFRAKKKLEDVDENNINGELELNVTSSMYECPSSTFPKDNCVNGNNPTDDNNAGTRECSNPGNNHPKVTNKHMKVKRRPHPAKALTLGPLIEKEAVKKVSFDVFTVNESNVRVAWKPPACHKASSELCQIVFKGARMKRRCLDLPLPLVLTYRKLDCKVHHCNFTLFHPHARKAFKEDANANVSIVVRTYGDTVMTQEFYHYFVSLLTVMKMKSSQFARHLTGVWETILVERLQATTVPEEYRKIITLSKQTVKSIWASIEEESGKGSPTRLIKSSKKRRRPQNHPINTTTSQTVLQIQQPPPQGNSEHSFITNNLSIPQNLHLPIQDSSQLHTPQQQQQQQQLPHQIHQQEFHRQPCIKRFLHVIPKSGIASSVSHPGTIPHHPAGNTHTMFQGHPPPPPHWISQPHPHQYPPNMPYSVPPHHDEYYSVQASFVTQYTPASIGTSP